jgi:TonB family protein
VARADQGIAAPASVQARLGLALAASLLVHGALLSALPRAWQPAATFSLNRPVSEPLRATLPPAPGEQALGDRATVRKSPPRSIFPAPTYFAAHELDRRPQIQSQVEPRFPALALGPTGRVVLQLYVDEAGRVDKVAVESGDPTGGFEAAAREAFAAARFLPGLKDGVPVKALVRIEVLFGSPHPDNVE